MSFPVGAEQERNCVHVVQDFFAGISPDRRTPTFSLLSEGDYAMSAFALHVFAYGCFNSVHSFIIGYSKERIAPVRNVARF